MELWLEGKTLDEVTAKAEAHGKKTRKLHAKRFWVLSVLEFLLDCF